MKVERTEQNFKPVTITLETQEEVNVFYDIGNYSFLFGGSLNPYSEDLRGANHEELLTELWRGLK